MPAGVPRWGGGVPGRAVGGAELCPPATRHRCPRLSRCARARPAAVGRFGGLRGPCGPSRARGSRCRRVRGRPIPGTFAGPVPGGSDEAGWGGRGRRSQRGTPRCRHWDPTGPHRGYGGLPGIPASRRSCAVVEPSPDNVIFGVTHPPSGSRGPRGCGGESSRQRVCFGAFLLRFQQGLASFPSLSLGFPHRRQQPGHRREDGPWVGLAAPQCRPCAGAAPRFPHEGGEAGGGAQRFGFLFRFWQREGSPEGAGGSRRTAAVLGRLPPRRRPPGSPARALPGDSALSLLRRVLIPRSFPGLIRSDCRVGLVWLMGYYGDKRLCNAGHLQTPQLFAADPWQYPLGQVRPVLI